MTNDFAAGAASMTNGPSGRLSCHGFGFDPVMFIPELNQTFAQMDPDEKNRRSHRGQSAREMVRLLRNTWLAPDA